MPGVDAAQDKPTFNSLHASSGPSAGAESSLVRPALCAPVLRVGVTLSKIGGGEVALPSELEGCEGGRLRSSTEVRLTVERGGDDGKANRKSSLLFELAVL